MISGCAEAAVVVSADDEPVISVPSSPREVVEEAAIPGKDGPDPIPDKGREEGCFAGKQRRQLSLHLPEHLEIIVKFSTGATKAFLVSSSLMQTHYLHCFSRVY